MNQMLNSPQIQNVLNDPQLIRSIFAENPAVQQIVQVRRFISLAISISNKQALA